MWNKLKRWFSSDKPEGLESVKLTPDPSVNRAQKVVVSLSPIEERELRREIELELRERIAKEIVGPQGTIIKPKVLDQTIIGEEKTETIGKAIKDPDEF